MRLRTLLATLLCTSTLATTAYAHDEKYHKSKFVEGEVLERSGSNFLMSTKEGKIRVETTKDTVFEKGEAGEKAELNDIRKDDHVRVAGTKLDAEKMVAKEVIVRAGGGHANHIDPSNKH